MYPVYSFSKDYPLAEDDVMGIQALYGAFVLVSQQLSKLFLYFLVPLVGIPPYKVLINYIVASQAPTPTPRR